jgi:hypothetical protein
MFVMNWPSRAAALLEKQEFVSQAVTSRTIDGRQMTPPVHGGDRPLLEKREKGRTTFPLGCQRFSTQGMLAVDVRHAPYLEIGASIQLHL